MPKRLKIYPEKCIGCKSCELACSLMNDSVLNAARSRITALVFRESRHYKLPYNFPTTCRQCADAPCLASCPVNAISVSRERTGMVVIDYKACIRCGRCVRACPFGAMMFDREQRIPFKCQLCDGQEPACASICPTGSIVFVQQRPFRSQPEALQMKGFALLQERNKKAAEVRKTAPVADSREPGE